MKPEIVFWSSHTGGQVTPMHVYLHRYIYTHTHIYLHTDTYVHITHTYTHTPMFTKHTHTHAHRYTHTIIHTYIHMRTYTYKHKNTQINIYTTLTKLEKMEIMSIFFLADSLLPSGVLIWCLPMGYLECYTG